MTARKDRCRWTDFVAGSDRASRRPHAIAAMFTRHVVGDRGVLAPVRRAGVARDPLPFCGNLDRLVDGADVNELDSS